MDDIRTVIYPLPGNISAFVSCVNDCYTIMINDSLSPEARLRAYYHEMDHILNHDFESQQSADSIELQAHR